jgi:hypothetical protein
VLIFSISVFLILKILIEEILKLLNAIIKDMIMKNSMLNILKGSLLISLMSVNILAKDNPKNTTTASDSQINQFYYNKGYSDGKTIGYDKGYQKAIKDVLKVLQKYKTKMEAIESAKYLLREGKITYPQVFKVWKNGGYKIIITPPKVEDKLSITDLVNVLTLNNNTNYDSNDNSTNNTNTNVSSNDKSFHIQNEQYYTKAPLRRASSILNKTILYLPKTATIHQLLISSGKSFAETQKSYEIFFNSESEKNNFCKNIGVGLCNSEK